MENTTPKKLREKLKDYLDLAKKEKIRIKRRSGQSYILLTEEKFNELKNAVTALQKRLLGKGHPAVKEKDKEKEKSKEKTKKKAKKSEKQAVKKATKKTANTHS
jgi:PHD/YefM family antitoxin component YafN of YafNO toxin-antitoxin module